MRALVTGISGFVGGHLAEHLLESGDAVVGLSTSGRWPEGLAHLAASGPDRARATWPAIDQGEMTDLIARKQPEAIYHLAAQANPQASVADPRGTWALNLGGTLTLLEAVKASGLKPRVVLVGSGVCYGNPAPEHLPVARVVPAPAEQPVLGEQGGGRPPGRPALPGPRDRRGDGPPVQPRRPPPVVHLRAGGPGPAGRRGRGRAQAPRRGRQPRRRPRLHRRPRRRPRLPPAGDSKGEAGEIYNLGSGRGTRLARRPGDPPGAGRRRRSRSASTRRGSGRSTSPCSSPTPPSSARRPAGSRGSRSRRPWRICWTTGDEPSGRPA